MNDTKAIQIIGFNLPDGPYGFLSNWYLAEFELAGIHYYSVEQYMMYHKVLLARRYDLAGKIMETREPAKAKELAGKDCFPEFRSIESTWNEISRNTVKRGVRAKLKQNPKLLEQLLKTGGALIAECDGHDKFWGVGINIRNEAWKDVSKWDGKNWLGRIIMELREEFRNELAIKGLVEALDFFDAPPSDVWNMEAGMLKRIPQYYDAVHTYAAQLPLGHIRECFYHGCSLDDWELAMRTNMGGGLPVTGFYEMKQEVYEIERRLNGKRYGSEIFAPEAETWGLRGDPYFWRYLKNRFAYEELLLSPEEMETIILEEFLRVTGERLTEESRCYVKEFAHGGMSSGQLCGEFWVKTAIPMLKERLDKYNQQILIEKTERNSTKESNDK